MAKGNFRATRQLYFAIVPARQHARRRILYPATSRHGCRVDRADLAARCLLPVHLSDQRMAPRPHPSALASRAGT